MADRILEVGNLAVSIPVPSGMLHPVQNISLHVDRGETLCIVGESGCGKSLTSLAIMDLLGLGELGEMVGRGVDVAASPCTHASGPMHLRHDMARALGRFRRELEGRSEIALDEMGAGDGPAGEIGLDGIGDGMEIRLMEQALRLIDAAAVAQTIEIAQPGLDHGFLGL